MAEYVKRTEFSDPLIYSVNIEGPFEGTKKYNLIKLNLICGLDYVDAESYDGLGWVDAKQFVDDVQSEILVWYPDDESYHDVLEDNFYEECEKKPNDIWHYDDNRDKWYRDKYFYESLDLHLTKNDKLNEDTNDYEILLKTYNRHQDFNDKNSGEYKDRINSLESNEQDYDLYHHKHGGGLTLFWNKYDECIDESSGNDNNLKQILIDCIEYFRLLEFDFPAGKFLATNWNDLLDGVVMGIDPVYETAEGIIEYMKPIILYNKQYNSKYGEEGILSDEIDLYNKLVHSTNDYLKKNGYDYTIKESNDKFTKEDQDTLNKLIDADIDKEIIKKVMDIKNEAIHTDNGPYWYFTTHGVMPGSVPLDITILDVQDGENDNGTIGTFFLSDKLLTTNDLKYFDIIEANPKIHDINNIDDEYDFMKR